MAVFDQKTWNDAVFQKYLKKVPNLKENSLIKNGVLEVNNSLRARLVDGVGGNLLIEPIKGLLDGEATNYDGVTNIQTSSRKTFAQKKIVVGRAKGWEEKDFSTELTGERWLEGVAGEVAEYFQGIDMDTVLAILKGVFAMSSTDGAKFVEEHTLDISEETTNVMGATTINTASQKAFGDKKNKFVAMAFMHSNVATNLENLQLLDYLKYTDANGIQSNMEIGQIGNKLVIIDDDMPLLRGYETAESTTEGALKVVSSNPTTGQIALADVKASDFYPAGVSANDYVIEAEPKYVTYLLGKGAIEYCDCGAKVPSEVSRDPATNGGIDKLYTRQRKLFAPKYISWEGSSAIISPTNEQLETAGNWDVVNNGLTGLDKVYVDHKIIPFARIISRG